MENFFAFLIRLTIIFLGSMVSTLLTYYVCRQSRNIGKSIFIYIQNKKEKIKITGKNKLCSKSGFYEIMSTDGSLLKIYSSPCKMKLI